jgi:hypothetical protein
MECSLLTIGAKQKQLYRSTLLATSSGIGAAFGVFSRVFPMLLSLIQEEFVSGPVGFIASAITILSFVIGCLATLMRARKPVVVAGMTLSPHLFRLIAALMWSLTLSLGSGLIVGRIFGAHWLAGAFAALIAAFVIAVAIAAVAGHLAHPWINEVATVRRHGKEDQECFIGLTPLDEFTNLCTTGITWLVILALAVGLSEPWWKAVSEAYEANPENGDGVIPGMLSLFVAGFAIWFGRRFVQQAAATAFTAQSGIRWKDAVSISAAPTPPQDQRRSNTTPPKRRRKGANEVQAKRETAR